MKKTYKIEMMDNASYFAYLAGCANYYVKTIEIEANSKEEAIANAKVMFAGYVINDKKVYDVEELEAAERAFEERIKADEAKAKANKEKKLAKEIEKAEKAGMTLEEYRAKVRKENAIKRAEKRIAELEAELAEARKHLDNILNKD